MSSLFHISSYSLNDFEGMDSTELMRNVLIRLDQCEAKLVQEGCRHDDEKEKVSALLQETQQMLCKRDEEIQHIQQHNQFIENELETVKVCTRSKSMDTL